MTGTAVRRGLITVVALLIGGTVSADARTPWPDSHVARLEAVVAMQTLNAEILASPSATLVLEQWCRSHNLAAEPRIVADKQTVAPLPASAEQLQRLGVASNAELKYRRVELRCGDRVLSKADNWYVPARLTVEMNHLLETTDTPFGKAVAALKPTRQTIGMKMLWTPLDDERPCTAAADSTDTPPTLTIPAELFQHQAVLYTEDRQPFSEVRETYQRAVLAFAYPTRDQPSSDAAECPHETKPTAIAPVAAAAEACAISGRAVLWAYDECLWRFETDDTIHPGVLVCVDRNRRLIARDGECAARRRFKQRICAMDKTQTRAACMAKDQPLGPSVRNDGI